MDGGFVEREAQKDVLQRDTYAKSRSKPKRQQGMESILQHRDTDKIYTIGCVWEHTPSVYQFIR